VPSYLQVAPAAPGNAELADSIEAPLSPEILRQAEALAHDPVQIFELVRNEVRSELYAGSLRGAAGALRARNGNDVDQASLLVALLRSSGIPSRYVRGVVMQPIEELQAELRLASASAVLEALRRAGLAHRPVILGGRIAAVELERTWVSAYVPYVNYRGTVIDFSGKTWIPWRPGRRGPRQHADRGARGDGVLRRRLPRRLRGRPAERSSPCPRALRRRSPSRDLGPRRNL
jgi:hypothetical protein